MKITVDVNIAPGYILREAVGSGHCEGYEFDYCVTLPGHSMYITVDNENYIVKASDVIQAVIAAHINIKDLETNDA